MSSGFITESELAEIKKRRQEEWEKVRKPDDPIERPDEPVDNRSLFERLQEQKQKKDLEYEEAHKLKNMIKGLDDDEIEFLDLVDRTKMAADRRKNLEEEQELHDYRNRVASLQEKAMENKLQAELVVNKPKNTSGSSRPSQHKLLKGAVVKKGEAQKRKLSEGEDGGEEGDTCSKKPENGKAPALADETGDKPTKAPVVINIPEEKAVQGGLRCIGILPGLGSYNESSSESSSDSETESVQKFDMLGRKVHLKKQKESLKKILSILTKKHQLTPKF